MNNPAVGRHLVILGGGITGLAASYYATLLLPATTRITLIPGPVKGGWIQSPKQLENTLELGPRSLRHRGEVGHNTLELVYNLGLEKQLNTVAKDANAAKNRFILYNDKLNWAGPSIDMLKGRGSKDAENKSVMNGIFGDVMREPFQPLQSKKIRDESIKEFMDSRVGVHMSQNLMSALVHGIFSGDYSKLSMKSCFPGMYNMAEENGSLVVGGVKTAMRLTKKAAEFKAATKEAQAFIDDVTTNSAIYSFQGGMQTFSDALLDHIKLAGVSVLDGASCSSLEFDSINRKAVLSLEGGLYASLNGVKSDLEADHVISALPPDVLSALMHEHLDEVSSVSLAKTSLAKIVSADVAVVNLVLYDFPNLNFTHSSSSKSSQLPVDGFGFLIPNDPNHDKSIPKVIGVIFDSCTFHYATNNTVLTVMINHIPPHQEDESALKATLLESAKAVVAKHLKLDLENLIDYKLTIQRSCIPQYVVGYEDILADVAKGVNGINAQAGEKRVFGAIGSWKGGVGINDCIWSAKGEVEHLAREWNL